MNMHTIRALLALTGSILALALYSCTKSQPVAGGGSDLPNGATASLSGRAVNADSTAAAGVEVLLRKIVVTSRGDSVALERRDTSGSDGSYHFGAVSNGRYVVYLRYAASGASALNQEIDVTDSQDIAVPPLAIARAVRMAGHIFLPYIPSTGNQSSIIAFIPGADCAV
jgi:hypothetical protein